MKAFNWDIGEVPEGWTRKYGIPFVINGNFAHGPMAAIMPPPLPPYTNGCADNLCGYSFHYDQRRKVQAWLDWFAKEYDE